jgi:hypothetical protein
LLKEKKIVLRILRVMKWLLKMFARIRSKLFTIKSSSKWCMVNRKLMMKMMKVRVKAINNSSTITSKNKLCWLSNNTSSRCTTNNNKTITVKKKAAQTNKMTMVKSCNLNLPRCRNHLGKKREKVLVKRKGRS